MLCATVLALWLFLVVLIDDIILIVVVVIVVIFVRVKLRAILSSFGNTVCKDAL